MDVPVWIFARFREGTLEPYVHYVPLADDCSDLEAKMDYYTAHPDEAEAIVRNANAHVAQFLDPHHERLISLLVMQKYFALSGQLAAEPSPLRLGSGFSASAARNNWA